jgi:hypothetical protein
MKAGVEDRLISRNSACRFLSLHPAQAAGALKKNDDETTQK